MLTAIIQARMTSTRLPGKVLKEVLGRPLLSYLFERLRRVKEIEQIVLATTTNEEDDSIVALCEKERVFVYRGSEHDVLDRYYQAAQMYDADPIMRVTADCPLIDVQVFQLAIQIFQSGQFDYIYTGSSFSEGLDCEIFSFEALSRAIQDAKLKSEREHITLYVRNHPELFRIKILENASDDSRYRITVDEPEDFEVVRTIVEGLYPNNHNFNIEHIKKFLNNRPEIFSINSSIIRNEGLLTSLKAESNS
ncbi:glycosyltransferase family protein [Candidatus Uhrbacteria bacterium]|nr:glycosyltransferase family protein [Candidatus Uhrbacteria bacterium]